MSLIKKSIKLWTLRLLLLTAAAAVTGCGLSQEPSSPGKTDQVNESASAIPSKPERIAALSLDAAEVVLELTDAERVAVVPRSIENPSLAFRTEEGSRVANKIAGATSLDPEQVLSYNADLLIMTKLHDKEKEATELLEQSGIPIISLESWSTMEVLMNNIMTIGAAIGEEKQAADIVAEMKSRQEKVVSAVSEAVRPTVLVVSPLGPGTGPYLLGSSNISYDLVRLAGAAHAADSLGLTRTTKATIEQIIKADPDYILLVEWEKGKNDEMNEVTQTPGWSTLQAVKNKRVLVMPARKLLNPTRYSIDTLEEIAHWLHPERL
ncbi:ABC transporter substrate-binding protein [Cohnella sp. LGH]|uniref:ABC transporter substrate-binding protein n=1 Tax=Cohnella sp. LGH TaxID=1619153 RepID=UPI001ADA339A|nr:ABC transporter substrate-binding protein [Cohnella sp. LGH]QTH40177.1 ABC transporter substrate-binding protein [Cohnella sp. LGH]